MQVQRPRFESRWGSERIVQVVLTRFGIAFLGAFPLACGSAPPPEQDALTATEKHNASVHRTVELPGERRFTYRVDCQRDNDCKVAWIQVDCCGTARALGVRADALGRLEREVEESIAAWASCECLASPTRLDDGSEVDGFPETSVSCREAMCTTKPAQDR